MKTLDMVYTSTLRPVFTNEVLKISMAPSLSLLQLTWQQHPSSEEYRRGYEQAIRLALENKARYWLTDSRQVHYLHLADQYWMYAKMTPLLTSGELHKFALVLQPETFMMTDRKPIQGSSEEHAEKEKLVHLNFFLDLASAQRWLLAGI